MISFLECNTLVCERYGHLNGTHYTKIALFLSRRQLLAQHHSWRVTPTIMA